MYSDWLSGVLARMSLVRPWPLGEMSARGCFQHTVPAASQEVFRGILGQEVWQGEVQGESCHGILGQEGEQHHSRNWVLEVRV